MKSEVSKMSGPPPRRIRIDSAREIAFGGICLRFIALRMPSLADWHGQVGR